MLALACMTNLREIKRIGDFLDPPTGTDRGAESWWDRSDSGLLIDSDSGSDCEFDSDSDSDSGSGSDTKHKINNTLPVSRTSLHRPSERRKVTFPIDFGFHSFGRKIFIPAIIHACRIASAPPPSQKTCGCQIIHLFRSCSDHARAEQEYRLGGVLLEPSWEQLSSRLRSSLIVEKSRWTLTCVTGSAASARLL